VICGREMNNRGSYGVEKLVGHRNPGTTSTVGCRSFVEYDDTSSSGIKLD
jgi:hypothetical protein